MRVRYKNWRPEHRWQEAQTCQACIKFIYKTQWLQASQRLWQRPPLQQIFSSQHYRIERYSLIPGFLSSYWRYNTKSNLDHTHTQAKINPGSLHNDQRVQIHQHVIVLYL